MKNIKNLLSIFAFIALIAISCTKYPPVDTSAEFSVKAADNRVEVRTPLTIYLSEAKGEFLTLYPGTDSTNTYNPDIPYVEGDALEIGLDSIEFTYRKTGTFPLTLIAISYGNKGETMERDQKTIQIEVYDPEAK